MTQQPILRWPTSNQSSSIFFWTHPLWIILIGLIFFTTLVTFLVMIYRWAKLSRREKRQSFSLPLTNRENIEKLKDVSLYSLVSERIQPINDDARRNDQTIDQYKSSLLQRRGPNHSLKITIATKQRSLESPPADHSSEEYLRTATRKLTIDELHQHALDTVLLSNEFWSIPTNHLEKLRICGAGTKNRYGTIIANEHSRVQLPELSGDPISSYINANYIRGWPDQERAYIATQGPLANTIVDFYRMIWQENVSVIVMITRLIERNKSKCERYIPKDEEEQYGEYHLRVLSIQYENDYEIRRLILTFHDEERTIDHYWYTAWPDQSCPINSRPLIDLVQRVEQNRINSSSPIVVHCSAGIGRTGCFIALSNGIKQFNAEGVVDVVRILCNLRQDRGGMIQTNDQYQFLYQALSDYARRFSTS